jgi:hypothetical protein
MKRAFNFFRTTSFATTAVDPSGLFSPAKKETLQTFFDQVTESVNETKSNTSEKMRNLMGNIRFNNRKTKHIFKKSLRFIVPLLFLIVLVLVIRIVVKSATTSKQTTANAQLTLQTPTATENLNKTFSFALKDSNGKDAGSFSYTIQNADIQNQIIVQAKPVNAVTGREFLIINLKLTNSLNKGIQINTRDYIRLSTNNDLNDWLAPEIHNDPVEVQAISTQFTRVGFPIYTTDKHLLLQIGEINGKKTRIPLTIQ